MNLDWFTFSGVFLQIFYGLGIMFVVVLMGVILYYFNKFMETRKPYPGIALIFELRNRGLLFKLDSARRLIAEDGKESYELKNEKKLIKAPEQQSLILTPTGHSAILIFKVSSDDYRFLNFNNLIDTTFKVLIPEDSKMWYLDQQRKKAEMWRKQNDLLKWAFLITPIVIFLISFLIFQQASATYGQTTEAMKLISQNYQTAMTQLSTIVENTAQMQEILTEQLDIWNKLNGG